MRVAITGTTGRVGGMLAKWLPRHHEVRELPRTMLDLDQPDALHAQLAEIDFDFLINPAGLTSPDACEDDPERAHRLNCAAPAAMAAHCAARGAGFLHFSTDYVFGGTRAGMRTEQETPDPAGVYGVTKRNGELAVLAAHPASCVLRVSWVFGGHKPSFVDQIVEAARDGRPLEAVADKFSLPTRASELCAWVDHLITRPAAGIVHACQSGEPASWHDMAVETVHILASRGIIDHPLPVAARRLDELAVLRAPRPRHTAMSTQRLAALLGHAPANWRVALADELSSRLESR